MVSGRPAAEFELKSGLSHTCILSIPPDQTLGEDFSAQKTRAAAASVRRSMP